MSSDEIDLTGSKVLIADDNEQNRELLDAYLADESYDILFSNDGQETMEVVESQQPDLILLDIMMPRMSGYSVRAVEAGFGVFRDSGADGDGPE